MVPDFCGSWSLHVWKYSWFLVSTQFLMLVADGACRMKYICYRKPVDFKSRRRNAEREITRREVLFEWNNVKWCSVWKCDRRMNEKNFCDEMLCKIWWCHVSSVVEFDTICIYYNLYEFRLGKNEGMGNNIIDWGSRVYNTYLWLEISECLFERER